jgi:hypothetical protein
VVVSLFGITNSTKDIVTLVNVKDQIKIKLFNAENPETEGEDKVSYVIFRISIGKILFIVLQLFLIA